MLHFEVQHWGISETIISSNCKFKKILVAWLFIYSLFFLSSKIAVGAAAGGGDFMSDLFNKLAMRRKG